MDGDLQYCIMKLSNASPQTLKQVRNMLDGEDNISTDYLVTKTIAAKILGVSRTTFWRMVKANMLPILELPNGMARIRMSDIQALITRCK